MGTLEQSEAYKQEKRMRERMEIEHWRTIYHEVRGALDFRVANLGSQQQRIANVLFANGLIFGFLGASAGIFFGPNVAKWPTSILYVASMCFLALGLVAAVAALWPLIDPLSASKSDQETSRFLRFLQGLGKSLSAPFAVLWNQIAPKSGQKPPEVTYFFEPAMILKDAEASVSEVELLKKLSRSVVANADYSNHIAINKFRRGWIRAQLIFIVLGVLLLIPALITRLFTG